VFDAIGSNAPSQTAQPRGGKLPPNIEICPRNGDAMSACFPWGGARLETEPNPAEVASIHRIPLTEFLRDDSPLLSDMAGSEHPVLRMPVGTDWIAAPTAALIYQFREVCLLGRNTRVAHYEQPSFAWR
jgi:hypothetical protein